MTTGQLTHSEVDLEYAPESIEVPQAERGALMALNRAVTMVEVAQALVETGVSSTRATGGAVVVFDDNRRHLRVLHASGGSFAGAEVGTRIPLELDSSLRHAVRLHQEVLFSNEDDGQPARAVLPLLIEGIALGAVVWTFRQPRINAQERAFLRALARLGGAAVYRAGLFDFERRARMAAEVGRFEVTRRDQMMAQVSATLDAAVDNASAIAQLARVAHLVVPGLGTWCAIHIIDARGAIEQIASAHVDPGKEQLLRTLGHRDASLSRKLSPALGNGNRIVIEQLAEHDGHRTSLGMQQIRALRAMGLKHVLVHPLRVRGRTSGTLVVASPADGKYLPSDLAAADRVARRCAALLEYMRLRDLADEAEHAREQVIAATSHELRTPLSHIKGFVSTLRTGDAEWDAATRDDFLAEIEQEADRLARLVERLLDMARVEARSPDPNARAAVLPSALVARGIDWVRETIGEHPLEVQVAEDLPAVWVDASEVERVLANLLDNAAKYSPPQAPITITAKRAGDSVMLRVEDSGLGIPTEDRERIFEPFFREPNGRYPNKPGSGLGLTICRSIVRAQNGEIWAEQRMGGGASLVFTLPIAMTTRRR